MTTRTHPFILLLISIAVLCMVPGCRQRGAPAPAPASAGAEVGMTPPTNRVDVPSAVRRNLGITFARAERRAVAGTLRLPGRFEWLPTARREYHTALEGRLELLVEQYQPVSAGTLLARVESPAWLDMQRAIDEAISAIRMAAARREALDTTMRAHELHEEGLRQAVDIWTGRIAQIEAVAEAGGGRAQELAQARISLNEARSALGEVMEKHAQLELQERELEREAAGAAFRLALLMHSAASVTGLTPEALEAMTDRQGRAEPLWRAIDRIEIRAVADGVVETLPSAPGAWLDRGGIVLVTVDPGAIRFRALGLQSDLGRFRDGMPAMIVPIRAKSDDLEQRIPGVVRVGLGADPEQRTVELIIAPSAAADWARAGVSAFAELAPDGASAGGLAIPLSCVVRDGLTPVIFRRDPADPDRVIRLEADLGIDDGRWVIVESGVRAGDEIVLDGAYQLLLATSGTATRGGHFHADGTWHADPH
ncbi:MAG: hypothetical protein KF817_07565 [Phycisphaeraceae bacterium]|nr:hypothetical protein [Phycisphaeraceae bacterium]